MAWLPLKIISLERGGLETATRGPRRRFFERDRIMRMDIKKRIMAASTGAVMAASLAVAPAAGAATAPVGGERPWEGRLLPRTRTVLRSTGQAPP
ncbi:hypothetical protein GCM10007073_11470 [Micrococcus flavus]|nr:hypothetical protein GCM10007073_11470 [Micrococcus flavus]